MKEGGSKLESLPHKTGSETPPCPRRGTEGSSEGWALKSVLEVAAPERGGGGGWGKAGAVSHYALLGLVLGQSLLVIKPHSTGVLPLGLNTKSASKTSLII